MLQDLICVANVSVQLIACLFVALVPTLLIDSHRNVWASVDIEPALNLKCISVMQNSRHALLGLP